MILIKVRGRAERLHLSECRKAALDRLAREFGVAYAPQESGAKPAPGWRALVNAIAEGRIALRYPETHSRPRAGDD